MLGEAGFKLAGRRNQFRESHLTTVFGMPTRLAVLSPPATRPQHPLTAASGFKRNRYVRR